MLAAGIALCLATLGAADEPPFTLEGSVRARTGAPVAGATVTLVASRRSTTTNADGGFTFQSFEITGPDQLVISHPEYRTARISLGALDGPAWRLDIVLRDLVVVGAPDGPP